MLFSFIFFSYLDVLCYICFFFFFQAEDGIRDVAVTGVQTCALPISEDPGAGSGIAWREGRTSETGEEVCRPGILQDPGTGRSEERRVGKECRSRWSPYH